MTKRPSLHMIGNLQIIFLAHGSAHPASDQSAHDRREPEHPKRCCRGSRSSNLSQYVGQYFTGRDPATGPQSNGDGRVEVPPPEIGPTAYAMVSTVKPNASDTPANPIPSSGNLAANMALPHPPNTSQNVPRNSAASFRFILMMLQ